MKISKDRLWKADIRSYTTIAVFILNGEIGEYTATEFEKALAAFETHGHPQILMFNNINAGCHEHSERLKAVISKHKQYWVDYDSLKELKHQFMSTLNWLLIEKTYK